MPGLYAHASWQFQLFALRCAFHIVANVIEQCNLTVQWFIQANQKTSPLPLLINIDVTHLENMVLRWRPIHPQGGLSCGQFCTFPVVCT